MSHRCIALFLVICLAATSSIQGAIINWRVLKSFYALVKQIRTEHHVTLNENLPICCVNKTIIQGIIEQLKRSDLHPIQRILLMQNLYYFPLIPLRHVINWNEKQYRLMQACLGVALSGTSDLEVRSLILMHENDEAAAMNMFPAQMTIGEGLSVFLAYIIDSTVPKLINFAFCFCIKEALMPHCDGYPTIFHFLKTGLFDQYIGDPINLMFGQCRSLSLIQCGVGSSHVDPYVLINESNRVFKMQTKNARQFATNMRHMTGELAALRAAGLDFGNEFRDPLDLLLRLSIKREFDAGKTALRNLLLK